MSISLTANGPTGLPFFTIFSAHAGLYRQLVRHPTILLDLPFFGVPRLPISTVNRLNFLIYHIPIVAIFAPSSGLRFQLDNRPMNLLVCHFPILAPTQGYIANYPAAQRPRRLCLYRFYQF